MRTNRDNKLFNLFGGIREVTSDLDDRINEIHGMYDREAGSLQRIEGKLLFTTTVSSGPIFSIWPLRFKGGVGGLFTKEGGSIQGTDLSTEHRFEPWIWEWPEPVDNSSNPEPPREPRIDPADWPDDSDVQDTYDDWSDENNGVVNGIPPDMINKFLRRDEEWTITPTPVAFDVDTEPEREKTVLESVTPPGGFSYALVELDQNFDWFHLGVDWFGETMDTNDGGYISTVWVDGAFNTYKQDVYVGIDWDNEDIPWGVTTITAIFTSIIPQLWSPPVRLKNLDGDDISTSLVINITRSSQATMVVTGTLDFVFYSGATTSKDVELTVANGGPVVPDLSWTRTVNAAGALSGQVTALPANGALAGGTNEICTVTVDPTGIAVGSYSGDVTFDGDGTPAQVVKALSVDVVLQYTGNIKYTWTAPDGGPGGGPTNIPPDANGDASYSFAGGPAAIHRWEEHNGGFDFQLDYSATSSWWKLTYSDRAHAFTEFTFITNDVSLRAADGYPLITNLVIAWSGAPVYDMTFNVGPNVW